jgi:glutathione S-transferase
MYVSMHVSMACAWARHVVAQGAGELQRSLSNQALSFLTPIHSPLPIPDMPSIEVPAEYGYVIAVGVASFLVCNVWMSVKVGGARKKYGLEYPHLYASKDTISDEKARNAFNCVQRGHQNTLEGYPAFLFLLLAGGLQSPVVAAIAGATFLTGKVVYFLGYSTGDPKKRRHGVFSYAGLFTLLFLSGALAFNLVTGA